MRGREISPIASATRTPNFVHVKTPPQGVTEFRRSDPGKIATDTHSME